MAAAVGLARGTGDYEVPRKVFLDFGGATVDLAEFAIEPNPGVRTLSPFPTFLGEWCLTAGDEPAVVRRIVRTARENLAENVAEHRNNPGHPAGRPQLR
ncbi:hypothetical protein [Actinophytocola algeriensis]|uniref:Uncharacterized protein n=1 Tax=Actinophytocola algeriensis TaxID=1768010 RepID=A0A7W7QEB4_9PSEU|nr:hypothetical protein [Actinophytocola algeriensis]MBB4911719.1 hypothetical protein [Actinophytocola algeriensis]MBE1473293.1 hypothetical protein [Actinophytocola algeriensis]